MFNVKKIDKRIKNRKLIFINKYFLIFIFSIIVEYWKLGLKKLSSSAKNFISIKLSLDFSLSEKQPKVFTIKY